MAEAIDDVLPLFDPKERDSLIPPELLRNNHLWERMPTYEMGDATATQKIVVHFRSREEVEEFARITRNKGINERTSSVWFTPDEEYIAPRELLYESDGRKNIPRYPVYVISKGRWERPMTANALSALRVPYKIVVEPSERDLYASVLGEKNLLVAPEDFSRQRSGSIPVRNWVWEHALASGAERHWILDDNIRGFLRVNRNRRVPVSDGGIFCAAEDFTDRYDNVAFAGFNYMYFVSDRHEVPPIYLNTRVYSMILVNNSVPYRWRGRYNEDTDICLCALEGGWATILFNAFVGDKVSTMTMKGGNTTTIYNTGDERLEFARSLARQHPEVARVVRRYGRWHHEVNYAPFAHNRLVERAGWREQQSGRDPEYGMRLVRHEARKTRYVPPPTREHEPVMLAPKRSEPGREMSRSRDADLLGLLEEPSAAATAPLERAATVVAPVPVPALPQAVAAPVVVSLRGRAPSAPIQLTPPSRAPATDPFLTLYERELDRAGNARLRFDSEAWDHNSRSAVGVDVECYVNFFVICFRRFLDGRRLAFERSERADLDVAAIEYILNKNVIISFNGSSYDLPMIYLALGGADTAKLKATSDRIISGTMRPWNVEKELGIRVPRLNHIDLMEPNPSVRQGLKTLHGRLHGRFLVDLPYEPDAVLTPRQMNIATLYCHNDLDATEMLYRALREPLELRVALARTVGGIDLRSKSDAQVGEAIIRYRIEHASGRRLPNKPPSFDPSFRYEVPSFISFSNRRLIQLTDDLRSIEFRMMGDKVATPEILKNLKVRLGAMEYSIGIGGLHSTEAHRAVVADANRTILDVDVASQYPSIIMRLGLYPVALGSVFLNVYGKIIEERLAAKRRMEEINVEQNQLREVEASEEIKAKIVALEIEKTSLKVEIDGKKIQTNGVFGKLGSPHSVLGAPNLMIAVTLTGQLAVLMLVDRAEAAGISVISANTDGIIFHFDRARQADLDAILSAWEADTGFTIERTSYRAIYSASVNSYVAIGDDGKVKRKGPLADPWSDGDLRGQMSKNPQMTVCSEAVVRYLVDGIPLDETIHRCSDPRMFVTVIKVNGGALWRGQRLGRTVRWYWSTEGEQITYIDGPRRVARTEGARPLVELTSTLPPDLDHARYVAEARKIAADLGVPEFQNASLGVE